MTPLVRPGRLRRVAVTAGALVLCAMSLPAGAAPQDFADAEDIRVRLDLKTVAHTNDERSITYTVETWRSFPDEHADFQWALDKDRDGTADLFVSARWAGKLTAVVTDAVGNPVVAATASRPAPNALRLSFPSSAVGEGGVYRYRVTATSDLDDGGVPDPGELDVAPETGWYQHGLSPVKLLRPRAPSPVVAGPAPQPVPAAPAPRSATVPAPVPARAPRAVAVPVPGPAPTPASTPAAVLASAVAQLSAGAPAPGAPSAGAPVPGAPASDVEPQPGPLPVADATLPRTGPGAGAGLTVLGGLLLAWGGLCVAVGIRGTRACRPEVESA